MLDLYVVIRAGSFSRHAVDMHSLCAYYELHGCTLYIEIYTQTGNGHVRPDQNDGKEDIQKLTSCSHV